MTCNFPSLLESKMWCSLGRGGHEQVGERESRSATPAPAGRQDAVARRTAGGGRAPRRRDAHDGEYLIEEKFGRRYSESQVGRILVGLGFSSQRPTSRALERDEGAIRRWKRVRWPALKKTPENKAESSSSSTSRD